MSATTATLLAGLAALGGAAAATVVGYIHDSRATFFQALDWLSSGTQRRSLGIATLEVVWMRGHSITARLFRSQRYFRDLSIPVLETAAVYLLLVKDQPLEPHEARNLDRIMELLLTVNKSERKRHPSVFADLSATLDLAEERMRRRTQAFGAGHHHGEEAFSDFASMRETHRDQLASLRKEAAALRDSAETVAKTFGVGDESDAQAIREMISRVSTWQQRAVATGAQTESAR